MFVLRVLSELSLILLVQDGVDTEVKEERTEENKERNEKEGQAAEERGDGLSCITESLLSRLVWFILSAASVFLDSSCICCLCRNRYFPLE